MRAVDERRARRVSLAGLLASMLLSLAPAAAQTDATRDTTLTLLPAATIDWRVDNPFRFFNGPADTQVHRATFEALSDDERQSPVLSAERALAGRQPDGWAATMLDRVCWDRLRNVFACPDGTPYIHPQSHLIVARIGPIDEAATLTCTWFTAPRGRATRRGTATSAPCDAPVKLAIPYPAGAAVTVEIGGVVVAETLVTVTDLLIVGMGDSFASGEGNPDVPVRFSRERSTDYGPSGLDLTLTGYPARVGAWRQVGDPEFLRHNARWLDQACHRSLYSQQLRAALQIALEDPHRAVTFAGLACSGAEVASGLFLAYRGNEWVPNPPELSQISAAAAAQCGDRDAPLQDLPEAYHMGGQIPELKRGLSLRKCPAEAARRIDLALVSIGGNDIGFSRLIANTVLADQSLLRRLGGWFGQVHGASAATADLKVLSERYKSLNRALHNILHVPWEESDRVILTAYPGLAFMDDGRTVCPDGRAGMDAVPDFILSAKKAHESSEVGEKLDAIMQASAATYGWSYVAGHRRDFQGRGLCAGYSADALSSADDLRLPRRTANGWEPFNPADYRPYASRQRWFRTPNDAFLTGHFHVPASLFQKLLPVPGLSWFQLLLASTYSGAFHPTAEGHAAIADKVADRARRVLAKYAKGPLRN